MGSRRFAFGESIIVFFDELREAKARCSILPTVSFLVYCLFIAYLCKNVDKWDFVWYTVVTNRNRGAAVMISAGRDLIPCGKGAAAESIRPFSRVYARARREYRRDCHRKAVVRY